MTVSPHNPSAKVAAIRDREGERLKVLEDLPANAKAVLVLQLKPKWSRADHQRMADMVRDWSPVHRQVFEDRFDLLAGGLGRRVRWS